MSELIKIFIMVWGAMSYRPIDNIPFSLEVTYESRLSHIEYISSDSLHIKYNTGQLIYKARKEYYYLKMTK